jgi:glycosyltransferase involved in cell wall biosynthesis
MEKFMSANKVVTFVIPSYNRLESCDRLVRTILECPSNYIEVIVQDNCSADGTYEALSSIDDARLTLYKNSQNLGALFNMSSVLELGTGEYVVFSTDQDRILAEGIPDFLSFLLMTKPDCGYCEYTNSTQAPISFKRGEESFLAVAYLGKHPTGYFFKRDSLAVAAPSQRFISRDVCDLFPFEFILAETTIAGSAHIYRAPLFIPETSPTVTHRLSSTTNGASPDAFFHPLKRAKISTLYLKHLFGLDVSRSTKLKAAAHIFVRGLVGSTFGFARLMRNKNLCAHYRMSPQNFSLWDLASFGRAYTSTFFICLRTYLPSLMSQINFFCYVVFNIANTVISKQSAKNFHFNKIR